MTSANGPVPPRRRGRRPAGSDTRAQIVRAAQAEFAARGYDGTSMRGVAREAGVDPALVHHYFDDKGGLFAATQQIDVHPHALIEVALQGENGDIGERILRLFLTTWDSPEGRPRIVSLLGAASTHADAARSLREFLAREIFGRVVAHVGGDQPDLRGSLVASQFIGLALARYVIAVPPLCDAPVEDVVRWIGPTVQRYLTDPLN